MSIANYNDLISALSSWLDHTIYAAQYPTFIQLFESTANRRLKTRQQEITTILIPSNPPLLPVSNAANNGLGAIRLTISSTTGMNTGDMVSVASIQGTSEANATWIVTVVDGLNIDLQGSTFVNPYLGGGTAQEPVGWCTIPTNFTTWRRLTWTGSPRTELSYVHPSYFQAAYPSQPTDVPRIFTIESSTIKIMPLSLTPLEFTYFAGITPLTVTNQTNMLMTLHPDIYLFGAMAEAENFGVNDERMPMWKARRDEIFQEIEVQEMQRHAPSYIRVFGVTP